MAIRMEARLHFTEVIIAPIKCRHVSASTGTSPNPHGRRPYGGWAARPLCSATSALHSALCPPFQCATWHSRPQYLATWQLLHLDSLPADVAAVPWAASTGARPQLLQTCSRGDIKGAPQIGTGLGMCACVERMRTCVDGTEA